MQVARDDKSPTLVLLKISGDTTDLEPIKRHVLGHFSRNVKVPGFRAGKAPAAMVEKHTDQKALMDEFLEHAINELYKRAVDQENMRPVGSPNVQLKKFVPYSQLEFETSVETIGEIKLPNYKNIKLPKPAVSVTSKDVDEVLKSLQARSAERKEVTSAAKIGDEVIIDFAGSDSSGKPIAGTDSKDYPLILGENTFIPGFEDEIVGLSPGKTKTFDITFPKDYGVSSLQGKKVSFKVTVKRVNELVKPKVDDSFAAKAGPFKTAVELKADIKKQLKQERDQQAERDFENELVRKIAEKSQVEIPEALINDQILQMEEEEKRNLVYRGQTWEEHLREEGVTEDQHRKRNIPTATERVKGGLILSEIANVENLQVSEDELQKRVSELKDQYQDPQMRAELDKSENRRDIAARLLTEKTIERVKSYN